MTYPKFYKNKQKFTCIKSATEFIQLNTLLTVKTISFGSNEHFVNDAMKYDIESNADEFKKELINHQLNVHVSALDVLNLSI